MIQNDDELVIPPIDFITEYRWYYNSNGHVTVCVSNSAHFLEGDNYIVVSKEIYDNPHRFVVKDKVPVPNAQDGFQLTAPLIKSNSGFRVVKNNASILLESHETYTEIDFYDYRNN